MSSPYGNYLDMIGINITVYFGIFTLIGGIIGDVLNLVVLVSLRTFRRNSCAFYLTVMSFTNIGQLITGLLPRTLASGFAVDWGQSSLAFCKLRVFLFPLTSLISFTCICLATIDQYFATCSRPRWQRWCNIKLAQLLVICFVILWTLQCIPYPVLTEHTYSSGSNAASCATIDPFLVQYRNYVIALVLTGFFPVAFTVFFGTLAYYNVRTINYRTIPLVRREFDKQLTVMVLVQVLLNFFTVLPFPLMSTIALNAGVTVDPTVQASIRLASILATLLYYFSFAVSEYRRAGLKQRDREKPVE